MLAMCWQLPADTPNHSSTVMFFIDEYASIKMNYILLELPFSNIYGATRFAN
jgi:hypothetical protein